jgi:predicted ribosomally synthesized peptide with SipW-like signal peptide
MRGGRQGQGDERAESGDEGGVDLGDLFSSKKKDDDDDDEDRLLPAAVAGALAVGGLAVLGGTFGYFSSVSKAPIGLMAGYVQPRSGILLQVAVNEQVFGKAEGPENLVASISSFYDLFHAPIQPAVGLGVRATEEGTETAVVKPSISFGFVGNFGKIVLLAGYDVTTPDFRFGIGVNFRARR